MKKLLSILSFFLSLSCNGQRDVIGRYLDVKIYKNVCAGNSLTAGNNCCLSLNNYPLQLAALLPRSTIINLGVGAQTTGGMLAEYDERVDPLFTTDTLCVLSFWEGGNSLWYYNNTDSAKSQLQQYGLLGWATGYKNIVGTIPYRGYTGLNPAGDDSATYNRRCDTVNTWLRANYTNFADRIVNFDQDTRINDFLNFTYRDADMIHYNAIGYSVIAALFKEQLITL